MICLNVKLIVKSGQEKNVLDWFRTAEAESRKEPGCLFYVVHQHLQDPRKFLVYEQYKDEATLEAHWQSPHFKEYVSGKIYPQVEAREADLYRPIS